MTLYHAKPPTLCQDIDECSKGHPFLIARTHTCNRMVRQQFPAEFSRRPPPPSCSGYTIHCNTKQRKKVQRNSIRTKTCVRDHPSLLYYYYYIFSITLVLLHLIVVVLLDRVCSGASPARHAVTPDTFHFYF